METASCSCSKVGINLVDVLLKRQLQERESWSIACHKLPVMHYFLR